MPHGLGPTGTRVDERVAGQKANRGRPRPEILLYRGRLVSGSGVDPAISDASSDCSTLRRDRVASAEGAVPA